MTTRDQFQAKVDKASTNMERLDGIVNGPAEGPDSLVSTDSGNVPTFARVLATGAGEAGDGRNLVAKEDSETSVQIDWGLSGWGFSLVTDGTQKLGVLDVSPLEPDAFYSVQFKARVVSGSLASTVALYADLFPDTLPQSEIFTITGTPQTFRWEDLSSVSDDMETAVLRLVTSTALATGTTIEITDIKLERGRVASAWTPSDRDKADKIRVPSKTELAAGDGSDLVGDRWPAENITLANVQVLPVYATVRTVPFIDQFREASDPSDDWAPAIDRYRASSAGRVNFPADRQVGREYPVSRTVALGSNGAFEGGQKWNSIIVKTGAPTGVILDINGASNTVVRDLHVRFDNEPAANTGAIAIRVNASQTCTFENLWLNQVGEGLVLTGGGGNHKARNIDCYGFADSAVKFAAGVLDSQLEVFNFFNDDDTKAANGGLRFEGNVERCTAWGGEIKGGMNAIATANYGLPQRGSAPFECGVSKVALDSTKGAGALLRSGIFFTMDNCWIASAGHESVDVPYNYALDASGVDADQMIHLAIINSRFFNNGGRGALFYNTNRHVRLIGNTFAQNGFTRSTDYAAVEFLAGSQQFLAQGNTFERVDGPEANPPRAAGTYRQRYAISVASGCDHFSVTGNTGGGCEYFNASTAAVAAETAFFEKNTL